MCQGKEADLWKEVKTGCDIPLVEKACVSSLVRKQEGCAGDSR